MVTIAYDDRKKDFVETDTDEIHANYCIFIIDIKSYIIAIESKLAIALSKTEKKLKDFLPREMRSYVSFELMADKFEIYDRVKGWDKFKFAKFDLTPTNPDNDPEFAELDKLIQDTGGDKARLIFQTQDGSTLSTNDKSLVMQGIAMTSAGYGDFTLTGEKNGHPDKIKTKDKAKLKRTFETDGTDIEKKIIDFNKSFKSGKDEKG